MNPSVCIPITGIRRALPEKNDINNAMHPYTEKNISSSVVFVNGMI
jgi:hypothetical protein